MWWDVLCWLFSVAAAVCCLLLSPPHGWSILDIGRAGGLIYLSLNLIGGACRRPRRNRKFIGSKNNAELLQKGGSECEGGKRYIPSSNNKTERKQIIFKPPRSSRSANSITFIFFKRYPFAKRQNKSAQQQNLNISTMGGRTTKILFPPIVLAVVLYHKHRYGLGL